MSVINKTPILALGLILCTPAWSAPSVHVQQVDPDVDISSMAQKGVKLHRLKDAPASPSEILEPATRDRILEQSGLAKQTSEMDDADRDVLVLRARNFPLARLETSYPKMQPSSLQKLKELLLAQAANPKTSDK